MKEKDDFCVFCTNFIQNARERNSLFNKVRDQSDRTIFSFFPFFVSPNDTLLYNNRTKILDEEEHHSFPFFLGRERRNNNSLNDSAALFVLFLFCISFRRSNNFCDFVSTISSNQLYNQWIWIQLLFYYG